MILASNKGEFSHFQTTILEMIPLIFKMFIRLHHFYASIQRMFKIAVEEITRQDGWQTPHWSRILYYNESFSFGDGGYDMAARLFEIYFYNLDL